MLIVVCGIHLVFCWSLTLVLKYTDPNKWWQQIPQIMSTSEWLFLNASLAYCIYDFIHTDHRRKGALIFYAHHVLTLLLIVFAYAVGFVQVSIVILNVFDVSDIFRPAARICNTFAKAGHLKYKTYANILFVLFATSWVFYSDRTVLDILFIKHGCLKQWRYALNKGVLLGLIVYEIFGMLYKCHSYLL